MCGKTIVLGREAECHRLPFPHTSERPPPHHMANSSCRVPGHQAPTARLPTARVGTHFMDKPSGMEQIRHHGHRGPDRLPLTLEVPQPCSSGLGHLPLLFGLTEGPLLLIWTAAGLGGQVGDNASQADWSLRWALRGLSTELVLRSVSLLT